MFHMRVIQKVLRLLYTSTRHASLILSMNALYAIIYSQISTLLLVFKVEIVIYTCLNLP